jgi:hypothetical protein
VSLHIGQEIAIGIAKRLSKIFIALKLRDSTHHESITLESGFTASRGDIANSDSIEASAGTFYVGNTFLAFLDLAHLVFRGVLNIKPH